MKKSFFISVLIIVGLILTAVVYIFSKRSFLSSPTNTASIGDNLVQSGSSGSQTSFSSGSQSNVVEDTLTGKDLVKVAFENFDEAKCYDLDKKFIGACRVFSQNKDYYSNLTGDGLFWNMAFATSNPDFCDFVSATGSKIDCYTKVSKDKELSYYISQCTLQKDIKVCDKMKGSALASSRNDCIKQCNIGQDFNSIISKIKQTKDKSLCKQMSQKEFESICTQNFDDIIIEDEVMTALFKEKDLKVCDRFKTQDYKSNCLKSFSLNK